MVRKPQIVALGGSSVDFFEGGEGLVHEMLLDVIRRLLQEGGYHPVHGIKLLGNRIVPNPGSAESETFGKRFV